MVGNALKLNCEMRAAERFLPARGGGKWNDVGKRGGSQPEVIRAAAEKLGGRGLESIRVSTEDAFGRDKASPGQGHTTAFENLRETPVKRLRKRARGFW